MSLQILPQLDMARLVSTSSLPQCGTFDDLAAMAVVATLTALYLFRGTFWDKPDPYLYKMFERPQETMQNVKATRSTRDIGEKLKQTASICNRASLSGTF